MSKKKLYKCGEEELCQYDEALFSFCFYMSKARELSVRVKTDQPIGINYTEAVMSGLDKARKELLQIKESIGFNDELRFMDNMEFQGFRLCDGNIMDLTDRERLDEIIEKWCKDWSLGSVSDKCENHFRYEMAVYLIHALDWCGGYDEN